MVICMHSYATALTVHAIELYTPTVQCHVIQYCETHSIDYNNCSVSQIQQTLGKEVNMHTVLACFLIQEGADTKLLNIIGQTPLQGCEPSVVESLSKFLPKTTGYV